MVDENNVVLVEQHKEATDSAQRSRVSSQRLKRGLSGVPANAGIGVAILLATVMLVVPIISLIWTAFTVDDAPSIGNFDRVLSSEAFAETAWNTVVVGLGGVIIALGIAIPLCWLYARTDFKGKNALLFAVVVQMGVPGFLIALGYTYLGNPSNGLINVWWRDLTGSSDPLINVYSLGWITGLQGVGLVVLAFFLLTPAFRSIDSSIEEAGTVHGVGKFVTAIRLSIPVIWPTIASTAIVIFIVAIEMFDYAGMLGMPRRIFVLSTWIFTAIQGSGGMPDYGLASAVGVIGALVVGALMVLYYAAARNSARLATVGGKRSVRPPVALSKGAAAGAWVFFGAFLFFAVILPVAMLVWTSLIPYVRPPSPEALAQVSLAGYESALYVLEEVAVPTILLVVAAATLTVFISATASWFIERTKVKARKLLDLLIMMSLAIPSIVMAVAFLRFGLSFYSVVPIAGTVVFLIVAVSARLIATTNRTIGGAVVQLHPELEEAASASGIPRGRTFFRIVLPSIREGLIFGWFWAAMLALRELTIVLMLSSPENQVISTRIFFYSTSGDTTTASALGVIQLLFMAVLIIGCFPALRRARI